MDKSGLAVAMAVLGVLAAGGPARGAQAGVADDPLLVVVEPAAGADVTAGDVRQVVGAELGRPVLAPGDRAAGAAGEVLIVALDGAELRMSLRGAPTGPVSRAIPAPAERATRLRAIAWLAGNVARDQVSRVVATTTPAPHPSLSQPGGERVRATERGTSAPPPFEPAAAVTARPTEAMADATGPLWTVTVGGGPTAAVIVGGPTEGAGGWARLYGLGYQIEVRRQATPQSPILGAVLDAGAALGSDPQIHVLGIAGLAGSRWARRGWSIEGTVGVGLEAVRVPVTTTTVSNSATIGTSSETTVSLDGTAPVLYARAAAAAVVPLGPSFDLVVGVGVHLTTAGLYTDFATLTSGVRMRLP